MLTPKTERCLVCRRVFARVLSFCSVSLARAGIALAEVTSRFGIGCIGSGWGAAKGYFERGAAIDCSDSATIMIMTPQPETVVRARAWTPNCSLNGKAGLILALFMPAATIQADIHFDDVTAEVGINNVGPSWGAAWGDFNGDGLPDLWASNHIRPESLYVNMGDHFIDIGAEVISGTAFDTHGAAWADFDNDGDQDLIQLADIGSNSLMVNMGDMTLQNLTYLYGLNASSARGRTPLWVDYDRDGLLDLMVTSTTRPGEPRTGNSLFRQQDNFFTKVDDVVGLNPTQSMDFMMMTDLTFDRIMELVAGTNPLPEVVYDTAVLPFGQTGILPPIAGAVDIAVADFNGDLLNDVFAARGLPGSELLQVDEFLAEAHIKVDAGAERGIDVVTAGDLSINFAPNWLLRRETVVYAGTAAVVLTDTSYDFELPADDPAYHGMPPHSAGSDHGIFIGYDPVGEVWSLRFSNLAYELNLEIVSTNPMSAQPVGFDAGAQWFKPNTLLLRAGAGFSDQSAAGGVDVTSWGRAVVAGDFDNDMDIDIYIISTGHTRNRSNILYENTGNAVFVPVASSGAAGPVQGKGDAIAMADYDVDGYLDLLLTNGKSRADWDQDGPVRLLRNSGGSNNWLQIDLHGVESNRDGVGSIVYTTAGGVTQIREQNGGMHHRAQNHQRLHFGLASNPLVDTVVVHWPSGIVQELTDVPVNQVITIVEDVPDPIQLPCISSGRGGKFSSPSLPIGPALLTGIQCVGLGPGEIDTIMPVLPR